MNHDDTTPLRRAILLGATLVLSSAMAIYFPLLFLTPLAREPKPPS